MSKFYTNVALSKNDILLCGYEDGKRIREKVKYSPYLFQLAPAANSKYRTLHGQSVGKIPFDSIREAKDFYEQYKDVDGMTIFGMTNYIYPFIYDNYRGDIDYDAAQISTVSLDIEVDIANDSGFPDVREANNEVTLITISRNGKKAVFGCGEFINPDPANIDYWHCKDELALLRSFLDVWNSVEFSPDILTGWNIEWFDVPYLVNRINRVLGNSFAKRLSPWGMLQERNVEVFGREQQTYTIVGIATLDYLQLYKKFAFTNQDSFTLDHIAFQELGERKLDYGEYGSLAGLQVGNYQRYVEYNIRDVELVDRLEDKLGLIGLAMAMAYDAKVNFQDTFTTVRPWDVIIHNYLLDRCIVVPQVKEPEGGRGIMGGYVKDPKVGMHDWVISFDLNSLYPHLIMQYNISPETYIGKFPEGAFSIDTLLDNFLDQHKAFLKEHNVSVTANMCMFTREKQGFLPQLMQKYYDERVIYKGKMIEAKKAYEALADKNSAEGRQLVKDIAKYDNLQMAKKIQLNSCYGALLNKFFRWFESDLGEAITSSGQLSTRWIEGKLNAYINKILSTSGVDYVIACDTDSVYITAGEIVKKMIPNATTQEAVAYIDRMCVKAFEPYIDKCYEELREYMNGYQQKMKMKREAIADKGIWTAKKRYILNVYNLEGVSFDKPKLKMMGIEAIRTSTPQVCRTAIKEALEVIMTTNESSLQSYVSGFRDQFNTMSFQEVAFPRSVRDLDKYHDGSSIFRKGTPINVKGSLIYNHHLKKQKLDRKYEAIASGQKIKYAYCIMPNPLHATVVACPSELPTEFNMDKYIDREKQFDKSFLEPIKTIADAIGWECERRATLDAFFV